MERGSLVAVAVMCAMRSVGAQDTLLVSMRQADSLLTIRSLELIVQHYEVDVAEAARVQARLFRNPSVATEWSVRPTSGRVFDTASPNGQMAVSVEKLFQIAGQRNLAIKVAEKHTRLAEAEYAELAAALRYRLHTGLYRQFYMTRAISGIGAQLDLLEGLVNAYSEQLAKGNVSLKELARLRASYFQLTAQRTALRTELNAIQQELRSLLMDERTIIATPLAQEIVPMRTIPLDNTTLLAKAETNRPQVLAAQAAMEASDLSYRLEKRRAMPDLALGGTYDRNSNYLPNYTGLNAGVSLPLFDRNQGHIRMARAQADQARAQRAFVVMTVRQEVLRALADLQALQEQYTGTTRGLEDQLTLLSESLVGNFVKSNLSLLEFTDLFESYTASIIAINNLKADLQQAYEELEYVTGQRLFTP